MGVLMSVLVHVLMLEAAHTFYEWRKFSICIHTQEHVLLELGIYQTQLARAVGSVSCPAVPGEAVPGEACSLLTVSGT